MAGAVELLGPAPDDCAWGVPKREGGTADADAAGAEEPEAPDAAAAGKLKEGAVEAALAAAGVDAAPKEKPASRQLFRVPLSNRRCSSQAEESVMKHWQIYATGPCRLWQRPQQCSDTVNNMSLHLIWILTPSASSSFTLDDNGVMMLLGPHVM